MVDLCLVVSLLCVADSHFCEVGVANVNSNVATAVRTVVVLFDLDPGFLSGVTKPINQLTREKIGFI